MAYLLDSNILLRLVHRQHQEHAVVRAAVRKLHLQGEVCYYTSQGVQVHDARLTAAMKVHGLTRILTLNEKDFVRYTGLIDVNPRNI